MNIRTRITAAAFLGSGLAITVRAQMPEQTPAPVQTSTHPTAPPADDDFYALRAPAAAGVRRRNPHWVAAISMAAELPRTTARP
jgi:hypothetical protein